MALTKIDDRGLTTPIDLLDNEKIRFGTGNDLEIHHDGSNNWIKSATGQLKLETVDTVQLFGNNSETLAQFNKDGASYLYYDGSNKLETHTTGVVVHGNISPDNLYLGDNEKAYFGDGSDLQIYHNGSDSYVDDQGTGQLRLASDELVGLNTAHSEYTFKAFQNGAVELYYDNSKKLETTSTGASIDGHLTVNTGTTDVVADFKSTDANAWIQLRDDHTNDTAVMIGANDDSMMLRAGSNTRITIAHTGKVGIGEDDPDQKLHIYESATDSHCYLHVQNNRARNAAIKFTTSQGSWLAGQGIGADVDRFMIYDSAEKFSIDANGHAKIHDGDLVIGTSGHGIMFHPHDETTSTPGSDSNLLDDYEEGTFTPSISSTSRSGTITYSQQVGFYTKIGNRVFAQVYMQISGGTNQGNAFIVDGLPFTNVNTVSWEGGGYHTYMGALFSAEADRQNTPWVTINSNYVKFYKISDGSPLLGTATTTASNYLIFHVQYVAA